MTEDARAHTRALTCLALDLLMVSEIGFFFSFTALLEKSSTNSPKSTAGSTTLSQTDEAGALNSHTSQETASVTTETAHLPHQVSSLNLRPFIFICFMSSTQKPSDYYKTAQ